MKKRQTWSDLVLAADPFADEMGAPGDRTLSCRIVVARATGECMCCAQQIVPGTPTRRQVELFDGILASYRWCFEYCDAMAKSWTDHGEAWAERERLRSTKYARPRLPNGRFCVKCHRKLPDDLHGVAHCDGCQVLA